MDAKFLAKKDDVMSLKKKLETSLKERDHTETENVLIALGELKVPTALQVETRLNIIVTKLTTNDNENIAIKAKELNRKWREGKSPVRTPKDPKKEKATKKTLNSSSDSVLSKKSKSKDSLRTSSPSVNTNAPSIANEQRTKIASLIRVALESKPTTENEYNSESLANEIEECLWNRHLNDGEYINHYRAISFSIKDPKNGWLHPAIVEGTITPLKLVEMEIDDLASEESKTIRNEAIKSNIFNRGLANDFEGETDLFTCGRCKKSRTTYKQLQTRSADEPMTSFIKCLECGHRWKQN
jgi:transcription elongation factor S-II